MSDGSAHGTLARGRHPAGVGAVRAPRSLTDVNGTLFFTADDGVSGSELWKTDGTAGGTTMVSDIRRFGQGSHPRAFTDVDGTVFFTANDGTNGFELWRTDGTGQHTTLVKDIRPGAKGSHPSSLTDVGGTLFFTANEGSSGYELWKSDGTSEGTTLVRGLALSSHGSRPQSLTDVDGVLYFVADDGIDGFELWKSDGSASGTVLVSDIRPGPRRLAPVRLDRRRREGVLRRRRRSHRTRAVDRGSCRHAWDIEDLRVEHASVVERRRSSPPTVLALTTAEDSLGYVRATRSDRTVWSCSHRRPLPSLCRRVRSRL